MTPSGVSAASSSPRGLGGGRRAPGRLLVEEPAHDRVELGAHLWPSHRGRRRCVVDVPVQQRDRCVSAERRCPGEHLGQDAAHGVQVRLRPGRASGRLLGGDVRGGADDGPGLRQRTRSVSSGDAEVHDPDPAVVGDEDVARGDVAVDHAGLVRGVQRLADVSGDAHAAGNRKRPVGAENVPEGAPADQLHDDERGPAVDADVEDRHQPGVQQRGDVQRLPGEAGEEDRVGRVLLSQDLHGHLAVQDPVPGRVDDRHPASAQRRSQLVPICQDTLDVDRDHRRPPHTTTPIGRSSFRSAGMATATSARSTRLRPTQRGEAQTTGMGDLPPTDAPAGQAPRPTRRCQWPRRRSVVLSRS